LPQGGSDPRRSTVPKYYLPRGFGEVLPRQLLRKASARSDEGHDPSTHPQHIDKGATMWWFWWFLIGALAVLAVISVTIYTVVKNRKEEKIFDE
jgi:hypothetical protein